MRWQWHDLRRVLRRVWKFIWEDDSLLSWVVNVLLAFIIIKFIVYPGLGAVMATSHPIVAVVSGSMEHKTTHPCLDYNPSINECITENEDVYRICGVDFEKRQSSKFEFFWDTCGPWYEENTEITPEDWEDYDFPKGFNKGDIMILRGVDPAAIETGDTIVYLSKIANYPIIHRVVGVQEEGDGFVYTTKGDHNGESDPLVKDNQLIGKAVLRIPFLGWIKIGFVKLINAFVGLI